MAQNGSSSLTDQALLRVKAANAMSVDWDTKMTNFEWGIFWPEFPHMAWFWFMLQPLVVKFVYVLVPILFICLFLYSPACFSKCGRLKRCRKEGSARHCPTSGTGPLEAQISLTDCSIAEVEDRGTFLEEGADEEALQRTTTRKACWRRLSLKALVVIFFLTFMWVHFVTMDGFHDDPPIYDDSGAVTVFTDNENGYFCHKIPSLLHLANGVLLAFAEARVGSCSDFTWTDLVLKRSVDNGRTWSKVQVLRAEGRVWSLTAVGNAAPVQLRQSGRVLLPHLLNNSQVWLMHSDDDGITWSLPSMLNGVVDPEWRYVGLGPPGSLQLASGRVLVPAYHGYFRSNSGNLLSNLHTLYSDDDGASWHRGSSVGFGETNLLMNEVQAVELTNSSVLFLSRAGGTFWEILSHLAARSDDGGETFTTPHEVDALRQPVDGCEGSLARSPSGTLMWVTPAPTNMRRLFRRMLTVFESRDEGSSWSATAVLHPGGAGYSSLVNLGTSMGLLYELDNRTELITKPTQITFLSFDLSKTSNQSTLQ